MEPLAIIANLAEPPNLCARTVIERAVPKHRPWTVALHQPLVALTEGLWHVDAELAMLPIGRRMVIVRLATGDLVVHNAIACDDATMAAIDALGPVRWIIVPSNHHGMDTPAFAARYPSAKIVTPAGSAARLRKKCRLDGELDALPADPTLRWETLEGVPAEAVFVHTDPHGATTLVFNDALMNLPARLPGFKGFIVKLMGSCGGPKVTRTAKFFIIKDKGRYADHLRRLVATPALARVIPAHGAILDGDCAAAIVTAANRLRRAT